MLQASTKNRGVVVVRVDVDITVSAVFWGLMLVALLSLFQFGFDVVLSVAVVVVS